MVGLDQPNIHKLVLDVTNEAQIQKVVSFVVETEGRIDILVNNAGMMCPGMCRCSIPPTNILTLFKQDLCLT